MPDAVVILYRWRLRPGLEAEFAAAWAQVTEQMRAVGSLGSRLHRGQDGLWYAYAQWPSLASRDEAFARSPVDPAVVARMRGAVEQRLPEVVLEPVADLLLPLPVSR